MHSVCLSPPAASASHRSPPPAPPPALQVYLQRVEESVAFVREQGLQGTTKVGGWLGRQDAVLPAAAHLRCSMLGWHAALSSTPLATRLQAHPAPLHTPWCCRRRRMCC